MDFVVQLRDVNTLAFVVGHAKMTAGTYVAEADSSQEGRVQFFPPDNTGYSLDVSATGYSPKTVPGVVGSSAGGVHTLLDVYLSPPPPPTPPPSGESVIGTVGTSCDILTKSMFGRSWYSYRNRYTGKTWNWDSERGDAEYAAGLNPECFVIPEKPPDPTAPGNVVDAISQKISAGTKSISDALGGMKNTIETKISDTLAGIANLTSITTDIRSRLDVLAPIKKFTDDFRFPSWDDVIVQPIDAKLQPLRDLKTDIGEFLTFKWIDGLILKVEDAIDRRASALVGVDPAKPFWQEVSRLQDVWISNRFGVDPDLPFFDAVYAKYERKIDVWISGKFGVDVEKPFWEEMEKKIIALAVRSLDAILEKVIP